jgi:DNA-binding transcriptional LysR family regulator
MDLDLRKLRYFLALAEERHFGRAAERLLIAQPVLSRQIRALEHELGCQLLTRSTRSVELTAAGRQLQADGPGVLTAADLATSRTLERARGVQRLVVGFAPGLTVSTLVRAYGREHPDVDVQMLYVNWYEQAEAVIDGRVDVGYLRGDFSEEPRLRTVTVGEEARVACMPENHPLARRRSLKLSDLDGEMMLHAEARRAATIENKFEQRRPRLRTRGTGAPPYHRRAGGVSVRGDRRRAPGAPRRGVLRDGRRRAERARRGTRASTRSLLKRRSPPDDGCLGGQTLGACGQVGFLRDVLRPADEDEGVIDDRSVLEGQLTAPDESHERRRRRVRSAELHHTRSPWLLHQQPAREMERPVAEHVDVLVRDQHDPVEVESEDAEREFDVGADDRNEPHDVQDHPEDDRREEVVEGERNGYRTLAVDMSSAGHPSGHALVVGTNGVLACSGLGERARTHRLAPVSAATVVAIVRLASEK